MEKYTLKEQDYLDLWKFFSEDTGQDQRQAVDDCFLAECVDGRFDGIYAG